MNPRFSGPSSESGSLAWSRLPTASTARKQVARRLEARIGIIPVHSRVANLRRSQLANSMPEHGQLNAADPSGFHRLQYSLWTAKNPPQTQGPQRPSCDALCPATVQHTVHYATKTGTAAAPYPQAGRRTRDRHLLLLNGQERHRYPVPGAARSRPRRHPSPRRASPLLDPKGGASH